MIARAPVAAGAAAAATLAALVLPVPAFAAPAFPAAEGRCVDQTGVLGDDLCSQVTTVLRADEKASSDEIAVAVVPTTGDASIEAWSTGVFNHWGVGKATRNNGVLLVVAVDDRRVRLETGRGMAERLGDSEAADIVDTVVTPRFADDEYALGVLDGLDEVRRRLGHEVTSGNELVALAKGTSSDGQADVDGAGSDGQADADSAGSGAETDRAGGIHDGGPVGIPEDGGFVIGPDGEIIADEPAGEGSPAGAFVLIAFLFVGLAAIGIALSRGGAGADRRHSTVPSPRRYTAPLHHTDHTSSTNHGSGSTSDFGGGSSGGGGASGSW